MLPPATAQATGVGHTAPAAIAQRAGKTKKLMRSAGPGTLRQSILSNPKLLRKSNWYV